MSIVDIFDNDLNTLDEFKDLKADFVLALSCTKNLAITNDVFIDYIPTIDAEFISRGQIKSFEDEVAKQYISHSAVFTKVINNIKPFENISFLNLGFKKRPRVVNSIFDFNIQPTNIINDNAMVESQEIFQKGLEFGRDYKPMGDYIIVSTNMPFSELSSHCVIQSLGFKDTDTFIKNVVIKDAKELVTNEDDLWKIINKVGDNILPFLAGFVIAVSQKYKVVLSGANYMSLFLLTLDKILYDKYMTINSENIYIFGYGLNNIDEVKIYLEQLSFDVKCFFSKYDFNIEHITDTNGLGASLIYSSINGIEQNQIISELEKL
jgi:hypothetical protein